MALWGNAAAIPVIVALTQLAKKSFPLPFQRKSDILSLAISIVVCFGWWLYNTPEALILEVWSSGPVALVKGFIDLLIISFATWLSASKSYDFFVGDKKWQQELDMHIKQNQVLLTALEDLKNTHHAQTQVPRSQEQSIEESLDVVEELQAILEGRD